MKDNWIRLVGIFASLLSLIWLVGLAITFNDYFSSETSTINKPEEQQVEEISKDGFRIVALGDSLSRGTGDMEGKGGYVGLVFEHLKQNTNQDVLLQNLAINGLTSKQLAEITKQTEVQRQIKGADLILMTIGGNDLFRGGQTLLEMDEQEIESFKKQYLNNLNQIFTEIKQINSDAFIFVSGLYNPFIAFPNSELTSQVVMDWNYQSAREIAKYPKAVFVPTYDIFQLSTKDYLADDQFHPNTEGYQKMADRIASLITWVGEKNNE